MLFGKGSQEEQELFEGLFAITGAAPLPADYHESCYSNSEILQGKSHSSLESIGYHKRVRVQLSFSRYFLVTELSVCYGTIWVIPDPSSSRANTPIRRTRIRRSWRRRLVRLNDGHILGEIRGVVRPALWREPTDDEMFYLRRMLKGIIDDYSKQHKLDVDTSRDTWDEPSHLSDASPT